MENNIFSEWVPYKTNSEKNEAKSYLLLWKKYMLRKVPSYLELKDENWLEFPEICMDSYPVLALRLELKKKFIKVSDDRRERIQNCYENQQVRSA